MHLPLLILHITGGTLGILSGFAAMFLRKGSRWHAIAGKVFVVSMLTMASCGAVLAFMKQEMNNVFGGILTIYLVVTAWTTVRRRDGQTHHYDWAALLVGFIITVFIFTYGIRVATSPTGPPDGTPAFAYFVFGSVALLSIAGDLRMLLRGGLFGSQRLIRHLWRMSFSLFIASASLFLARPHLFPNILRITYIIFLLGIAPLLLMVFWLIRVRFAKAFNAQRGIAARSRYRESAYDFARPQRSGGLP
jgi:Predicted membrane protein (DUF2306)